MSKMLKYAAALTCAGTFAVVMAAPSQAHEWQRDRSDSPSYMQAYDYAPAPVASWGTASLYNGTNERCQLSPANINYTPCYHH